MSDFFAYSLAVYGRAEVARSCLALQNREGLDVNLILFCLWAATKGRRLEDREITDLIDAVAAWQQGVVATFRDLRRWLKDQQAGSDAEWVALRDNAKRRELEAEEIEQRRLEAYLEMPAVAPPDPAIAAANLRRYLAAAGRHLTAVTHDDLTALLAAAWPGMDCGTARDLIGG
jgi:uncharacterized protein (TIGR02444 family)